MSPTAPRRLGRHNDGRERRAPLYRLSWLAAGVGANGIYFSPFPNTPLRKCCGRRSIQIALRPLVFMKLADALQLRMSPAGRGLGAVNNATSIQSGGY